MRENFKITTKFRRFVDGQGRERLFNGLNMVCKEPDLGFVYPLGSSDYQRLSHNGINVLRFGIYWAAIEPNPGEYNETYLQRVKEQLIYACEAGIFTFLDFHQDLYGVSFGGGAPAWAEVTDGLPHITGDLWSDAYLISPALNRAIEHFWNNDPLCGIGLQEYFFHMLKHTVAFFSGTPGLLGYDIWNEPYPGLSGQRALSEVMALLSESGNLGQSQEKARLIAGLTDIDFYRRLTDIISQHTIYFEQTKLMSFYRRASEVVHGLAPQALIFTEPCYFTNLGADSGIMRIDVPGQVFAPHGYDLIVDTGYDNLYDPQRVKLIFQRHRQTGERLDVPILIGEWGAFEGRPGNEKAAGQMLNMIEQNLWSHTYWSWAKDIESRPEWGFLVRAYPAAVAGKLISYHWDGQLFEMLYDAEPGITEVFVPNVPKREYELKAWQGAVDAEVTVWGDTGHAIFRIDSNKRQRVRLSIMCP